MQDIVKPLSRLGATLVAISPQGPALGREVIAKHGLTFDIVSDPRNAYTARLGLRFALPPALQTIYRSFGIDLPACNGDDSWTLPMPARLVIDRQGIVRATDVDPDYTRRPEPAKTLADVQSILD